MKTFTIFLVWIGFACFAAALTALRSTGPGKLLGAAARPAADLIAAAGLFFGIWYFLAISGFSGGHLLWRMGFFWALLFLLAEALAGRFFLGLGWQGMFRNEYNVLKGRTRLLLPLALLFGPILASLLV